MARAPKLEVQLESTDPVVSKPRLVKLIIKNYRCIGQVPVEIDLDEIVVLVGPNNVGKSSILKAYELAMSQGSNKALLQLDDFPGGQIVEERLPEIEVHTVVYDNTVGSQWIDESTTEKVVREKWVWSGVGAPQRFGWDMTLKEGLGDWSPNVPWGAPNIANSHRPEPHRVDAFASPDDQAKAIQNLLTKALTDRIKNIADNEKHNSSYTVLLNNIKRLQKDIVEDAKEEIDAVNRELSSLVSKVFTGYRIDFDAKPEDQIEKTINLFKADPQLLMGPADGHMSSIDKQGSGARRTLLWTALKYIAENTKSTSTNIEQRPNLLLIDEPEICLHPSAIRDACNALYELPSTGRWQVMVTTHSPVFIDFSKDNTTIVRVEKDTQGHVKGTTVYKPNQVRLDADDKINLKLMNMCDPYVAEFFFGGKVVVVEGDTEYTAFNYIKSKFPDEYRNVHIVRARGKATIRSMTKILNHFGANYSILHDSDSPLASNGNKNSAWTTNQLIIDEVQNRPKTVEVRIVASIPNFEQAYFNTVVSAEKPYTALKSLLDDQDKFNTVKLLLDALVDFTKPLPATSVEWDSLTNLKKKYDEILAEV